MNNSITCEEVSANGYKERVTIENVDEEDDRAEYDQHDVNNQVSKSILSC